MLQVYKFDSEGNYIEPVIIYPNEQGEYEIPVDCTDQELPQPNWKPKFDGLKWIETITEQELDEFTGQSLAQLKQNKLTELNQSCNASIIAGFEHSIEGIEYHFSFDTEAQLNFQGAERILDKGLVPTIEWTVTRNGEYERTIINKAIMDELVIKILQHKDSNIRKLRNELMPLVESAQTIEELNQIVW